MAVATKDRGAVQCLREAASITIISISINHYHQHINIYPPVTTSFQHDRGAVQCVREAAAALNAHVMVVDEEHPRPNLAISIPMAIRAGLLEVAQP